MGAQAVAAETEIAFSADSSLVFSLKALGHAGYPRNRCSYSAVQRGSRGSERRLSGHDFLQGFSFVETWKVHPLRQTSRTSSRTSWRMAPSWRSWRMAPSPQISENDEGGT